MAIIEIKNLTKVFEGGTRALDKVDLVVNGPDFLVILGPSGAGKSTLIRSINRLVSTTDGSIQFHDREITGIHGRELRDVRKKMGMIFQQFNLIKRLNVLENVLVGRIRFQSFPSRFVTSLFRKFSIEDQRAAFECLCQVGIERQAYQRADTLSGGQQQRVAIARAMAQGPDMILADEPIASLDPKSSDVVMGIIKKINMEKGIPVIVNLHQYEFAKKYATRIVGMNDGRIVYDGPPENLDHETLREIYKGGEE